MKLNLKKKTKRLMKFFRRIIKMPGIFAIDLYDDSNPRRRKVVKPTRKREPVKVEPEPDLSEIGEIRQAITDILEYLNGKNNNQYIVKILPNKPNCFRATVFNKETNKVLIDFFVEKIRAGEYVYTPPLDIKAFTVNSYENRNQCSSRAW